MTQTGHDQSHLWHAFVRSRLAAAVAGIWGFAEATLFFLVPDIWIGLLAMFSWRAGPRAVAWAVAGALAGGALMYGVGAVLPPEQSARLLEMVPAVSPAMIERVEEEMQAQGPAAMLLGPLQGTPYKIYARTAGVQGESLLVMLLWSVPARAARFLLIAAVAALFGWVVRRVTPAAAWRIGPYLVAWGFFYLVYFWRYGF